MSSSLSPIEARDRITSLDIIRGFALFGVFLANMPLFQWPQLAADLHVVTPELSTIDRWIRIVFDIFIETKFFSIFSFLFGLGFYIFMTRAEAKGQQVCRLFSRRLVVLALFGLIHLVLFWYGDILLKYALAGFFLILFYKCKPRTILIWIVGMTVVLIGLIIVNFLTPADSLEQLVAELQVEGEEKIAASIEAYKHASFSEWISYRFTNEVIPVIQDIPFSIITALYMFLFGLYAGKRRFFENVNEHIQFNKRVCWTTGLIGLPISVTILFLHIGVFDYGVRTDIYISSFTTVGGPFISLCYISGILLLLQTPRWNKWLSPLSFAGRMALTNYLTQTLISMAIFTGLGYYGELHLSSGLVLCLMIYPVQIGWSRYWLKRFRYGPFEWLWRSLTYGKFQPMRIKND